MPSLVIRIQTHPLRFGKTKGVFLLIALIAFGLMLYIDYDRDFFLTAILPLVYAILILLFVGNDILNTGLAKKSLIAFYCFRMCLLPVICALGNFYLEPDKKDYINKYDQGILLTCFEALIVFVSLSYFTYYYGRYPIIGKHFSDRRSNHFVLYCTVLALTVFILMACELGGIKYFHFITEEATADSLLDDMVQFEQSGIWYIIDILCTWWRPLFSFVVMYILYNKFNKKAFFPISFVALMNVLFMSERRIFALLVGGFCFYYLMILISNRKIKNVTLLLLLICIFITVQYSFYGSMEAGMWMISRTFQRYFSGPTLTAMALEVNDRIGVHFLDFFKLLLNDFQIFTGTIGSFPLIDYYYPIFGMSIGIWTPLVAGSLRYFGLFFPLIIIFIVRYIVICDCYAQKSKDELYKMIYSYIGVSVACYMIMYTVELIIYFMLSTAFLYKTLAYWDYRIKIKRKY